MKIALFAALTLAAVSVLQAGPVDPPSLLLDKAATIAQKKLEELKLPPEYFLRSIVYSPVSEQTPIACYIASYEPPKHVRVRLRVTPGEPTPTPEPVKLSFIHVFMDGTATLVEREMENSRKIIIK